jgi:molecular chaperone DnaK (HSP70)
MSVRTIRIVVRSACRLVFALLLAGALLPADAQRDTQLQKPVSLDPDKSSPTDTHKPFAEMEEEMRAKRAIKSVEKEYQDNIDRARDLSSLVATIVESVKQRSALTGEDLKKLEKVEKLAKGIRHAAGGSEDEVPMKEPPTNIASAMEMLGDLGKSLKDKVEGTPKHVISAAVIDEANVLLELIRIVRTLPPKI